MEEKLALLVPSYLESAFGKLVSIVTRLEKGTFLNMSKSPFFKERTLKNHLTQKIANTAPSISVN